jgi:hypothetical protein
VLRLRVLLPFWFGLSILLSGCIQIVAPTPEATATAPVIIVTQVITEIIPPTPVPVTPTAVKTNTPVPPSPTPTWDPLSAPIYYPLDDCVASRLHVGDMAQVSLSGGPNGIRYGRDLYYDTIVGYAQPGSLLEITNGPWCSRGWLVWLVRTQDGVVGYTPEGNGSEYWLFPTAP